MMRSRFPPASAVSPATHDAQTGSSTSSPLLEKTERGDRREQSSLGRRERPSLEVERPRWRGYRPVQTAWLLISTVALLVILAVERRYSNRIPFHYPLPRPVGNTTFAPTSERQIPPYVHYVFGLAPPSEVNQFNFIHYLCLTSAVVELKPEVLYFHYLYEPASWYWQRFKDELARSEMTRLEMVQERDVVEVFGNPVEHYAHKADVLRLEALQKYGGVYLDADVLVVRDLAPLYRLEAVMGMESQPNLDPKLPPSGLCNAVILAKPYSSFISRWIDTYRTFDKTLWAKHSVTTPWDLARAYPTEITVLNKFAFFWPIWDDDSLRVIHRDDRYNFRKAPSLAPTWDAPFACHLWESAAYERYLSPYDPDRIHNRGKKHGPEREEDGASDENSFSREARRFVSDEFRQAWREAKAQGLVDR
ncbi:hypothetical protein BMF94_3399 [Rhodotorula taiwanensis]|uniref:Alpha 1,4-glycosyltransferase domain-containing protein n=1 Tax=Rhodotorula taiwanensis TaxID=741276 RepID=A0A2S5B9L4_9BASI|nr:hypothetical protein BMF94_3399 [Rhodotorula taiwanensis]